MIRANAIIIVILLFTGVGCTNQSTNSGNTIAVDCEREQLESTDNQVSKLSTVEIGIDGSSSMQGYVNVTNSRYARTLDSLDSVTSNL
ncbi:MAG: hypothetical protein AB4372_30910, partial [Xenococcus sp. (in: cyanobacteria)]